MTRRMSSGERRAMADALRHMKASGVRLTDLRHGSGATQHQIDWSLERILLPGRDGIGIPSVGVVSPRQSSSSLAGGKTSQLAGRNGFDAPVAPASFPGGQEVGDGFGEGWARAVIVDRGALHSNVVARAAPSCHGAGKGRSVP